MCQSSGDIENSNVFGINVKGDNIDIGNRSFNKDSLGNKLKKKRNRNRWSEKSYSPFILFLFIANLFLLVCNLYYVCNYYPRLPESLGVDYLGIIIGVLSLLVTLLVGWQIYKTIEVDSKINNVEVRYKEMVQNEMSKITSYMNASAGFIQGVIVLSSDRTTDYSLAYRTFAIALEHYIESGIDVGKNIENCIVNMETSLKKEWNAEYDFTLIEEVLYKVSKSRDLSREQYKKLNELENKRKSFFEQYNNTSKNK